MDSPILRKPRRVQVLCALMASLLLTGAAAAETIKGSVENLTTGKPAAGAEVVLLSLSQGMQETARTKTDASGAFSFAVPDPGGPHLVRATHDGVNYFKMVPPGTESAEVKIYDAARKLDGVSTNVDIMRLQAENGMLEVLEIYGVVNNSSPPRTLMSEHTYEVALPEGAQIDNAAAQGPGGQPVTVSPVAVAGNKGHYQFQFPLRPGETRFQLAYHLPYSGEATIRPPVLTPLEHFVAMLPKSMQFTAENPALYQVMPDESGTIQVASNVRPGQAIGFKLTGTGTLAEAQAGDQGGQEEMQQRQGSDMRPGGGLGTPIDAPDPLSRYRWLILGTFAAVLAAGGFYVATHASPVMASASAKTGDVAIASSAKSPPSLLDAMKEELFQLELERQQGKISEAEYQKAKAALDETMKRALARSKQ